MLNSFFSLSKYPYTAFVKPEPKDRQVHLFHLECPVTKLLICYCPEHPPTPHQASLAAAALEIDTEAITKRRKLDRERYLALARPVAQPEVPVHYGNKHYCGDCQGDPETQQRKLVTVFARRKHIGALLPPGTTLAELGRRGRPRIYNREEDDSLSCYFSKCQRRSVRFDNDPDILRCSECRRTYHAKCSDPPLNHTAASKFSWQCLDCKRCVICGKTKEDSPLILCESCDRSFHSKCAKATTAPFHCTACTQCANCQQSLPPPEEGSSDLWVTGGRSCEVCWSPQRQG
jgi:hypothetical protein